MKYTVTLFLMTTSLVSFACISNNFTKLCASSDITYSIPEGFRPVEIKQNPDLAYHYAVKHKNKKLEIRYSIFPLKEDAEAYNEYVKNRSKKRIILIDPNKDHELSAITAAMNISRSKIKEGFHTFNPDAVKLDCNADWGASYYIENNSIYGKGYKYSLVVALHKKNRANAFIVYLFDTEEDVGNEIAASFCNLKFK
ncbi:MAG: hypothetical protein JXA07_06050 [Spirochaetes bacterium]|nr:hypothetical protein [Spirochaetota bacterium]